MSLLIFGQVLFMIPYVFVFFFLLFFFIATLICVIIGMLQNMNINN